MQYRDYNDYELLYMVQESDETAYNLLYEKYKPLVIAFAKKYSKVYSSYGVDINDFILEGYVGLEQAINKYNGYDECKFQGLVSTCINRNMQNLVRKTKLKGNIILNNSLYYESLEENSETNFLEIKADEKAINPENKIIEEENLKTIYNEYSEKLKGLELKVFTLKIKNYTNTEIAKLLNTNVKAINNAVTRIKKKYNK